MVRGLTSRHSRVATALLAVFFVGLGFVLATRIPESFADGRASASAPPCGASASGGSCISTHQGSLDGPYLTLRTGSDWYLVGEDATYGPMTVSLMGGRALSDGSGPATGFVWEERLVAVETGDGIRVEAEANGNRAWYSQLLTSVGLVALGLGFALQLRSDARSRSSAAVGLFGLLACVLASATLHVFGSVLASVVVGVTALAVLGLVVVRRTG